MDECKPLGKGVAGEGGALHRQRAPGRAVQVNRLNPVLKALGLRRLKLQHDEVVSSFAFNSNLRRYN